MYVLFEAFGTWGSNARLVRSTCQAGGAVSALRGRGGASHSNPPDRHTGSSSAQTWRAGGKRQGWGARRFSRVGGKQGGTGGLRGSRLPRRLLPPTSQAPGRTWSRAGDLVTLVCLTRLRQPLRCARQSLLEQGGIHLARRKVESTWRGAKVESTWPPAPCGMPCGALGQSRPELAMGGAAQLSNPSLARRGRNRV